MASPSEVGPKEGLKELPNPTRSARRESDFAPRKRTEGILITRLNGVSREERPTDAIMNEAGGRERRTKDGFMLKRSLLS